MHFLNVLVLFCAYAYFIVTTLVTTANNNLVMLRRFNLGIADVTVNQPFSAASALRVALPSTPLPACQVTAPPGSLEEVVATVMALAPTSLR